jgi:hypothetical protein
MKNVMHSIKYSVQQSTKQAISKVMKTISGEITIKHIAHLKHPNKLYHNEIYHNFQLFKEKIHQ